MLKTKRCLNSMSWPSKMNHWHLAYPFIEYLLRLVPFFFYPYRPVSLKRIQNKVKLIRWWWGTNKKKHELNLVEMPIGAGKVFVGSRTRHCGIVFHFPLGQTKIDEHGSWREGKESSRIRQSGNWSTRRQKETLSAFCYCHRDRLMALSLSEDTPISLQCCSIRLLPLLYQVNVINLSSVTKERNQGTKLQVRLNLEQ